MSKYLETIGRKVVKIPSNGKCLLLAIKKCLEVDFDIKMDEKNIACKIWQELKDSLSYYSDFITQNAMDLLNDACWYLSMKRNTYIEPTRTLSPATIYMLFVRDSKPLLDPRNTNAHYNAKVNTALNKDPDFEHQYVDETEVSPE